MIAALLSLSAATLAADWVVWFALIAALLLLSIAAASPTTWRELGASCIAWIVQALPAPAVVAGGAAREIAGRRWARLAPVARGLVLALLLVLGFGALFAWADAAFSELVDGLVEWHLPDSLTERLVIFAVVVAALGALWLIASRSKARPARAATRTLGRTEWLIALGALNALFALWITLQLATLFGGHHHVLETAGLTYAEYAREGFGQLIVIATLTLLVVAAAARFGPAEDRATRLLVGALCLLTIVVLGSALYRLGLYDTAFGSTRLRLAAHDWLLYLGALFVLLIVLGAVDRRRAIPRAVVVLSAVAALVFVASSPDARIANRNLERFASTGELDSYYFRSLSADAVPALAQVRPPVAACLATQQTDWSNEGDGTLGYNRSRTGANATLQPLFANPAAKFDARSAGMHASSWGYDYGGLDCASARPAR